MYEGYTVYIPFIYIILMWVGNELKVAPRFAARKCNQEDHSQWINCSNYNKVISVNNDIDLYRSCNKRKMNDSG
jgi:hypothetical protein